MASNGVTLPLEERMQVQLAIVQLKAELKLEEAYLWGKIEGKSPIFTHFITVKRVKKFNLHFIVLNSLTSSKFFFSDFQV